MYQFVKIVSNIQDNDNPTLALVKVEFSNGVNSIIKEYKISEPENLKELIDNEIRIMNKITDFTSKLKAEAVNLSVIEKTLSAKEQARKDYEEAVRKLTTLKSELELGIFDTSDKIFSDALQDAKNKRDVWLNT